MKSKSTEQELSEILSDLRARVQGGGFTKTLQLIAESSIKEWALSKLPPKKYFSEDTLDALETIDAAIATAKTEGYNMAISSMENRLKGGE